MVQKTGFGKSLIYQLLSLLWKDGIAIVFTPLISLMIDQI
jgi:superfamily II DNA helicase RecQ